MSGIIVVNGECKSAEEATIPALDRGFLFADSIFETMLALNEEILDLDEHLSRLEISAAQALIVLPKKEFFHNLLKKYLPKSVST